MFQNNARNFRGQAAVLMHNIQRVIQESERNRRVRGLWKKGAEWAEGSSRRNTDSLQFESYVLTKQRSISCGRASRMHADMARS